MNAENGNVTAQRIDPSVVSFFSVQYIDRIKPFTASVAYDFTICAYVRNLHVH